MLLPTPNQDEVARFRKLHEKMYGIPLTEDEAKATLTRLVQFYYLCGGHDAYWQQMQQQSSM